MAKFENILAVLRHIILKFSRAYSRNYKDIGVYTDTFALIKLKYSLLSRRYLTFLSNLWLEGIKMFWPTKVE